MHRAKGDRSVRASVLPVCDNGAKDMSMCIREWEGEVKNKMSCDM